MQRRGSKPKPKSSPNARHPAPQPRGDRAAFSPQRSDKSSGQKAVLPEGVFVVEGVAAIREYLRFKPDDVKQIYVKEKQVPAVKQEFSGFDVTFQSVPESTVQDDRVLPSTPVWAHVKHSMQTTIEFEGFLDKNKSKNLSILALDHISDPRNLGAIVRSAAFFGVKHVIVPERRQVLLTQSAVGTAQGGFALCDLVVVVNLGRTLELLKDRGFWILGAAMGGEPLDRYRAKFERQIIVLGSEDKGISPNVLTKCDVKVAISGTPESLESLNVSVAAGILLERLVSLP